MTREGKGSAVIRCRLCGEERLTLVGTKVGRYRPICLASGFLIAPEIHVGYFNPKLLEKLYQEVGLVPLQVCFSGVLQFKMIKNFPRFFPARVGLAVSKLGFLRNLLDRLYGVSAMPCATKPEKNP